MSIFSLSTETELTEIAGRALNSAVHTGDTGTPEQMPGHLNESYNYTTAEQRCAKAPQEALLSLHVHS